jgi:hypothetical protein
VQVVEGWLKSRQKSNPLRYSLQPIRSRFSVPGCVYSHPKSQLQFYFCIISWTNSLSRTSQRLSNRMSKV